MCLCIWVVKASDFQVGKLHYKIVSVPDLTVEVTYPNEEEPDDFNHSTYSGNIVIPATVQFKGKTFKVIGVGERAFYYSKITSAELPEGIEYIGSSAFYMIESLKSINIPMGLKELKWGALDECDLNECIIPSTVERVRDNALPDVKGTLKFEDGDTEILVEDETIKAGKLYIGRPIRFEWIMSLRANSIILGENVTKVPKYFSANLPEKVSLTVNNTVPPTIQNVKDNVLLNATIYVPASAIQQYKEAEGWKNFLDIKPIQ